MKNRWTMRELKEKSDSEILRGILQERMSELHPYSPLRERLQEIKNRLGKQAYVFKPYG